MDDVATLNLSPVASFQHHVREETSKNHMDLVHLAPALPSSASPLERSALSLRYSGAQSSYLSSSHDSRDFEEVSRFSSSTDTGDESSIDPLSSLAAPSNGILSDDRLRVKYEPDEGHQAPSIPPSIEIEHSGSRRQNGVDEVLQPTSPAKSLSIPGIFNLKPRSVYHNPTDNADRGRQDAAPDPDSINVVEIQNPAIVIETPLTQPLSFSSLLEYYEAASQGIVQCVTTVTPKPRLEVTDELRKAGRRRLLTQKYSMQAAQTSINGAFIFITWWWMRYYYILLPFVMATVALNVIMIGSIILRQAKNLVLPEKKIVPESPERLVTVVPCYNETKEELLKSLDCLVAQEGLDGHKRAILIICDGKVRGPGMEKTTADYLLHDILINKDERKHIREAYVAWDQQFMDVVVQTGKYGGIPYMCIVKQQNQGKRDSLVLVRSFLYNFNFRDQKPTVVTSSNFFGEMTKFLLKAGFDRVDCLVGIDADTRFEPECVRSLLEESRYHNTVGVCGYVMVDFSAGQWSLWRLYQSCEYTIAQGLRRLHQSLVTKKVSCLPGCCQLLKICEETCGDEVLIQLFGYCPTVKDGMLTHIRATASEDRNHVCHMLSARPNAETRQALRARAVTDVPHSWSVFLSQRRRWTLGATSNDLMLVTARGVQWFERILALVNIFTWYLSPFIIASLVSFIWAIFHAPVWILMAFVSIMLIPIVYYLCIPLWITKSWRERLQFYIGCFLYVFCGPFISIVVLVYALWNMDSFGWGKTRKVVAVDDSIDNIGGDVKLSETASQSSKENAQAQHPEESVADRMTEAGQEEKTVGIRGS